jgi:uncharacterized YccA/Bax inhibitor family protein
MLLSDRFLILNVHPLKKETDMDSVRVIPAYVHGIWDYLGGIALLLAPNLFGFADEGGEAVWIPRILGIAVLAMALLTDYRPGLLKVIPLSAHLLIDVLAGAFLALSPFIFGFSDEDANVWLPHLVVGIAIVVVALLTQTRTETEPATAQSIPR